MKPLNGKKAVVTGGSSGIGRAIAERFAADGAQVIIAAPDKEKVEETAAGSPGIIPFVCDITSDADLDALTKLVKDKFDGNLDILVNNAGWCPVAPLKKMTMEDYDKAFDVDVRALVNVTIHCLPFLLAAHGCIINLSSVGATHRGRNLSTYEAAKAAVENFTRVRAMELAGDGVRVNAIAPGAIRTNIWNVDGLNAKEEEQYESTVDAAIPMGRFGTPEEVANVAAFLVSDDAGYVTGSIYGVDGGMGAG